MAGVYTRDNINYSSMLQNAIANRNAAAQREAAYEQAKGKLWGDTINNMTKYAGRGIMASADQYSTDEDEAELEQLKAQKAYEEQVAQRKNFDNVFNNPTKLAEQQAARDTYIQNQYDSYADYKPNETYSMNGYKPSFDYTREGAHIEPVIGGAETLAMSGYKPIINHTPSVDEIHKYAYDSRMRDIYGRDVPAKYPEDYYTNPDYLYGIDLVQNNTNPYYEILQGTYRRGR